VVIGGQNPSVNAGLAFASPQETKTEQVAATIKANTQALKAFSYQQRTLLQLKGETKKVMFNQMNYDANGNLQKIQLSEVHHRVHRRLLKAGLGSRVVTSDRRCS